MKSAHLLFLISTLQITATFAEQEPKGIVVYQEPNTTYAEALEYRSFRKDNAFVSSLVSSTGQVKHLKTSGIVAEVAYPPYTFDDSFPDTAKVILEKVQAIEQQLPRLREPLELVHGKWERALSFYQQTRNRNTTATRKDADLPLLTVKSVRYTHAKLIAATYDSATISHNAGVAKIPIAELGIPEIVSLNTTSKSAQIGTISFLDEQARLSQSESATQKIRGVGVRALVFIANKTGFRYDTIQTWLFFVVSPVLIVVLLIINIIQARRPKLPLLRKASK